MDGKLLRFDRTRGVNQLFSGNETAHFVQRAPRVLQVAITNVCNKSCEFCYRPQDAASEWTLDELMELARFAADWGVLEFAFGGGEPTVFPDFVELMQRIWTETPLCPNFTTNGLRLTDTMLRELRGYYGQIQLSVYDDDDYWTTIDRLVAARAQFGLNYLITPKRLRTLEADVRVFMTHGVRDILLLSYKGHDSAMHLSPTECRRFDDSVRRLYDQLGNRISLKVDVCWGTRLMRTPQLLFEGGDCGANAGFLSIGSDKTVLPCSFAERGTRFDRISDIRDIYLEIKGKQLMAGPGCARRDNFGLPVFGHRLPTVT